MEIFLAAAATITVLVGSGQVAQHFLARHIQNLVLAGSKFHLAQTSSGAIELRSGVRQGTLTQKEASALAPALRTLVSKVRFNPILGLRLLSKNQGIVEAQGIEDAFLKAAVDSQRQELILLAEEHGVKGRAVELIMGVETDEDFAKLRTAISTADYGDDLPEALAKKLQLRDRRMVEPLVLWSSKAISAPKRPASGAVSELPVLRQIDTGKPGVVEETIPSLPNYRLKTYLEDRGTTYEKVVVEIRHGNTVVGTENAYSDMYKDLGAKVASMKSDLIKRVGALSAIGM